jgi:N-acetylneuraminate synthase
MAHFVASLLRRLAAEKAILWSLLIRLVSALLLVVSSMVLARTLGIENFVADIILSPLSNLRQMPELAKRFGTLPGLSDHTLGTTASVAAVALGACLIEKHFTLSHADKGPDSEFSLEPADLERRCTDARDAWLALGRAGFERQEAEGGSKVFRRSIYVTADLQPGAILTRQNLRCIRPGRGLPPKYYATLLGKRVNQAVKMGTPVSWELLHPFRSGHL